MNTGKPEKNMKQPTSNIQCNENWLQITSPVFCAFQTFSIQNDPIMESFSKRSILHVTDACREGQKRNTFAFDILNGTDVVLRSKRQSFEANPAHVRWQLCCHSTATGTILGDGSRSTFLSVSSVESG